MPSLKVPVINLGNRQIGRIQSQNILNSKFDIKDLEKNLKITNSKKFQNNLKKTKNVYHVKNTKKKIEREILKSLNAKKL